MLVEVQKWGNSAAVRVPSPALKEAGITIGQTLDLRTEGGRIIMTPSAPSLEELVGLITPANCHGPVLDDDLAVGNEVW
jgi:antitoxin MazE